MKWGQAAFGRSPFSGKQPRASTARSRGVTLVELIVTIVVISTAGLTLVTTLSFLSGSGGDHILQAQAQSVADAYLNEITGKAFVDPDGAGGETTRMQFDDVGDYAGYDAASASDEFGNPAGNYRVRVFLTPGTLGALPANDVWRIDVRVDYGIDDFVMSTGYRVRSP
jgi:MSHA pilin protein MshD